MLAEISIWNDLPVWEVLKQKGCADLIELHQQKYGYEMEPTCQGVTRPANAIISRHLIPYMGHVRVLSPEWFATHCPVFFSLQMPHETLHKMTLKMPTQLGHIDLRAAYDASTHTPPATTHEEWRKKLEHLVDVSLRSTQDEHGNGTSHLRKACVTQ